MDQPHQQQQEQEQQQQTAAGPLGWLRRALGGSSKEETRAKLAQFGIGAFLAYGVVSNLNAGVLMTISWLSVVKRTGGMTPLDPGQWPGFLAIYAGLYLGTNLLRPIRLAAALAVAPAFNRGLQLLQERLGVNRAVAIGLGLALVATTSFVCIFTAIAALGGFPNGLPALALPWQQAAA